MRIWLGLWAVATLLLAGCKEGASVLSKEAHALGSKTPPRPVGWTAVTTTTSDAPDLEVTMAGDGGSREGIASRTRTGQTVLQVLDPDRRRLTVQRDVLMEKFRVEGVPQNPQRRKGGLVGKYVVLERDGDKWTGSFEANREASFEESAEIKERARELSASQVMYGFKPRKVGSDWSWVEKDPLAGIENSYLLRFEGVEEFQGHRCAVIDAEVKIGRVRIVNGIRVETEHKGTMRIHRSLEQFCDLQRSFEGTITVIWAPERGVRAEMSGPCTIKEVTELSGTGPPPAEG